MTADELSAISARARALATRNPDRYRTRVLLLAGVGHVYILSVFALIAIVALLLARQVRGAGSLWLLIKLGGPFVIVAGVALRSLAIRFDPPRGRTVTRPEAPRLFETLDGLYAKLQTPSFDTVLISEAFNASATSIPRLGVIGFSRNYLELGLPLMHALSPGQLTAVVAHELGHLSRRHGRTGVWLAHVRTTWMQLLAGLEAYGHGGFLFNRFFRWYAPRLTAYSSVLAQMMEFEADRWAVDLTSVQEMGEGLITIEVKNRYMEAVVVPETRKKALKQSAPPANVFSELVREIRRPVERERADRYLTGA